MKAKREHALARYAQLPMPSFRYGLNIGIDASRFGLEALPLNELGVSEIKTNAPQGIVCLPLSEALTTHAELIEKHFMNVVKPETKFSALHGALWNNGLFVYVPKGVKLTEPVEISSRTTGTLHVDHLLIIAEEDAQISIIEHITSNAQTHFRSQIVEIVAKDNAQVNFTSVQNLDTNCVNVVTRNAHVGKSATVKWLDSHFGSKLSSTTTHSELHGEGAHSDNYAVFFSAHDQIFDLRTTSQHLANHSTSDMLTKGALTGTSKTIYRGLVKIYEGFTNCNGYQTFNALLLSERAEVDAIPDLEINNNEVKCSHGATIGQLDEEKLFYMMSRGLTRAQAVLQMAMGFFEPFLRGIPLDVQKNLTELITERLS